MAAWTRIQLDPLPIAAFDTMKWIDSVRFTNNSLYGDSYSWYFGDGDSSQDQNPYHVYDSNGKYTIRLVSRNACGSADTSLEVTIEIPVGQSPNWKLSGLEYYPNPSKNLVNFKLANSLTGQLNLFIYDNRGTEVVKHSFIKTDFMWKDQISIDELASGVYHVEIRIQEAIGHVLLIKH